MEFAYQPPTGTADRIPSRFNRDVNSHLRRHRLVGRLIGVFGYRGVIDGIPQVVDCL
jgi:hypothetical protein